MPRRSAPAPSLVPLTHGLVAALAETRAGDGPCISIYVPTHEAGPGREQDPIVYRNQIDAVDQRLEDLGCDKRARAAVLAPARGLLDDTAFWHDRRRGLAVFIDAGATRYCDLPRAVPAIASVADHHAVRHLLPSLAMNIECWLLTLSGNLTRLYRVTGESLEARPLRGVPATLDAMLESVDVEKSLQFHTGTAPAGPSGQRAAVFHGHGDHSDDAAMRMREFLTIVARGVRLALRGERGPLILAGDERVLTMFRAIGSHPQLIEPAIVGNVDHVAESDLVAMLRPIRDELARDARREAVARYESAAGSGRTCTEPGKLASLARDGQIELLLAPDAAPQSGANVGGGADAVETAVVDTLRASGDVIVLPIDEMPQGADVAALLRAGAA